MISLKFRELDNNVKKNDNDETEKINFVWYKTMIWRWNALSSYSDGYVPSLFPSGTMARGQGGFLEMYVTIAVYSLNFSRQTVVF